MKNTNTTVETLMGHLKETFSDIQSYYDSCEIKTVTPEELDKNFTPEELDIYSMEFLRET